MIPLTVYEAKSLARSLRDALPDRVDLTHGQSLDLLSRTLGFVDWNELSAQYQQPDCGSVMPVLRVTDALGARAFYVDVLGFAVEFEHRFETGMPTFLGVSRGSTVLGLSEHYGDGTPGSVVWIPTRNLDLYRSQVIRASAGTMKPGIERDAPGGATMSVKDHFGNELRFCEPR